MVFGGIQLTTLIDVGFLIDTDLLLLAGLPGFLLNSEVLLM